MSFAKGSEIPGYWWQIIQTYISVFLARKIKKVSTQRVNENKIFKKLFKNFTKCPALLWGSFAQILAKVKSLLKLGFISKMYVKIMYNLT